MSSLTNATCEDCPEYTFSFINVIFLVVYCLLAVFICGGNLLTIIAIWRTPVLRTVSNVYVALLAFSDFLAGLVLPYQMIFEVPEGRIALDTNKQLCLWRSVTVFVAAGLSICSMVAIAFDRAVFIGFPYVYNRIATHRQALIVACACGMIALAFGTPCLYNNTWTPGGQCTALTILTIEYQIYGQVIPLTICLSLAGLCYGYIFYIARKHQREIASAQRNAMVANDLKIIKVLFLVFGIFLICWVPLLLSIIVIQTTGQYTVLFDIFLPLAILNSGMNFIVYAVKNKDYRKAFKKILRITCECDLNKKNTIAPKTTNTRANIS